MDELIGFAVEQIAAAAKKKRAEGQRAQPEGSPDAQERYRRMLLQLQQRQADQTPVVPPVIPPPVVRAVPPAEPKPARQTAHDREEAAAKRTSGGALHGFLEDGNSLLRAVVAAEVLSPPLALRENPLWQIRRPNEPST